MCVCQSGISFRASWVSPVPLVTDKSGIAQLWFLQLSRYTNLDHVDQPIGGLQQFPMLHHLQKNLNKLLRTVMCDTVQNCHTKANINWQISLLDDPYN